MKKFFLLIPFLMIIFSIKVNAATSSYKNNPINNITNIESDCQTMGIDYSYYETIDNSDYDKTDVIGLWEYYYDDGSIDLFVYLYNPYTGESEYNNIIYNKSNLRFKEAYLNCEGNLNEVEQIDLRGLYLELVSVDKQISKYRYSLRNKDINLSREYSRKYEIKSIEYMDYNNESVDIATSEFRASFVNSNSDDGTINVDFEYDGYMFIFEKEAFRIYADLSQFEGSWIDSFIYCVSNSFGFNRESTVFTPELLSFNFNIPDNYDVKDINSIDFCYRLFEYTYSTEGLSEVIHTNKVDQVKSIMEDKVVGYASSVTKKEVTYDKDDYVNVRGEYLNNSIEFNGLKRIDNNSNRYNEKILDQEYININLDNYYKYEYSLIFDVLSEAFTQELIHSGSIIYSSPNIYRYTWIKHDARDMYITRMNYTDSNGETHNVIVNQGAPVDETTELPYYPLRHQEFFEWLWEKILEFYTWLFLVVGADTFVKKAITVACSILLIPLIPTIIKVIISLSKIIISFIKSIFKSIFIRKRQ